MKALLVLVAAVLLICAAMVEASPVMEESSAAAAQIAEDRGDGDVSGTGMAASIAGIQSQLESVKAWYSMQKAHMAAWPLKE